MEEKGSLGDLFAHYLVLAQMLTGMILTAPFWKVAWPQLSCFSENDFFGTSPLIKEMQLKNQRFTHMKREFIITKGARMIFPEIF